MVSKKLSAFMRKVKRAGGERYYVDVGVLSPQRTLEREVSNGDLGLARGLANRFNSFVTIKYKIPVEKT